MRNRAKGFSVLCLLLCVEVLGWSGSLLGGKEVSGGRSDLLGSCGGAVGSGIGRAAPVAASVLCGVGLERGARQDLPSTCAEAVLLLRLRSAGGGDSWAEMAEERTCVCLRWWRVGAEDRGCGGRGRVDCGAAWYGVAARQRGGFSATNGTSCRQDLENKLARPRGSYTHF